MKRKKTTMVNRPVPAKAHKQLQELGFDPARCTLSFLRNDYFHGKWYGIIQDGQYTGCNYNPNTNKLEGEYIPATNAF